MRPTLAALLLVSLGTALPGEGGAAPAAGPVPVAPPAISGTLRVGERLATTAGSWTASAVPTYAYQWYRCDTAIARCGSIHGATRSTYTLVAADAGKTIAATAKATDASGTASAYGSAVGPVAPKAATLVSTARPAIDGGAVVGRALRASTGTWSPAATAFTYAWERCNESGRICTPIAAATAATYTPVADDAGHALVVVVKAASGSFTQTTFSGATRPVKAQPGPTAISRPTIAGALRQGEKLTGAPGSWSGSGTITYRYAWYRCDAAASRCVPIRGATGGTYRTVAADAGRTVALTVEATDQTGAALGYSSAAGPVAAASAAVVSTVRPAITGTAAAGQALKVDTGTWSGGATAFAYAWQRCNANGRICTPIAGATTNAYTPVADDVGHALVAVVEAGAQATLSTATAPIG